jgi:tetratricopeptide (TPR) repeat protein
VRLLAQARDQQRLNADYPFRAARVMIAGGAPNEQEILALLDMAIKQNPVSTEYRLARARYMAHLPNAAQRRDAIVADYRRVLELNPNEVSLHLELADVLRSFNTPADREAARAEYEAALRYNDQLPANEPKRLKPERVAEIKRAIDELK